MYDEIRQTYRVVGSTESVAAKAFETEETEHGVEEHRLIARHIEFDVSKVTGALVL
jgi:hypothetical protein